MFLAVSEIRHSKLRYALVIVVMALVAYLVTFLTGLSYGLAQENRSAVDHWGADDVILSDDANGGLALSSISGDKADAIRADRKATLLQSASVVHQAKAESGNGTDVRLLGIDPSGFLAPTISEGRMFRTSQETVVDSTLATRDGIRLGDRLAFSGTTGTMRVVGFTSNAQLSVSPVMYMSQAGFRRLGVSGILSRSSDAVSAVVTRGTVTSVPGGVDAVPIADFIEALPGYRAQVLTFGFMIGFLVVIAAVVIGVFLYVLTLQKRSVFGVLKAQGVSTGYLSRSVVVQTLLLSVCGVVVGGALALGTALVLPDAVPFQSDVPLLAAATALMVLSAVASSAFSAHAVVRVDPVEAIA